MRKHSAQQPTTNRPTRNVGASILTAATRHSPAFVANRSLASALARAVGLAK
ncbi:hypothetical protein MAFF211491_21020 [Ralstonia solanacearum]|nr:hypothetical protein MAFF211491_21020 [Ralstonia solanacearum]BCM13092.1 hypothetical protein MAFF241648_22820 [Ralstonia solanacearum]